MLRSVDGHASGRSSRRGANSTRSQLPFRRSAAALRNRSAIRIRRVPSGASRRIGGRRLLSFPPRRHGLAVPNRPRRILARYGLFDCGRAESSSERLSRVAVRREWGNHGVSRVRPRRSNAPATMTPATNLDAPAVRSTPLAGLPETVIMPHAWTRRHHRPRPLAFRAQPPARSMPFAAACSRARLKR